MGTVGVVTAVVRTGAGSAASVRAAVATAGEKEEVGADFLRVFDLRALCNAYTATTHAAHNPRSATLSRSCVYVLADGAAATLGRVAGCLSASERRCCLLLAAVHRATRGEGPPAAGDPRKILGALSFAKRTKK